MATTFNDIFPEYFTLYRGQATNIPTASDPEYKIALQLANNSAKKWERADGVEWNELWSNLSDAASPTLVQAGVYDYPITGMRKPPKKVLFRHSTGSTERAVIKPEQVDMYSTSSGFAYFTGSASQGYTLHLSGDITSLVGYEIDFTYQRRVTPITSGASVIDMSDPNFLIHDMLAARFTNARNGFAVKVHKQEANVALQNMKIQNNTGTYGNSDNLGSQGAGFGVARNVDII